MKQLVSIVIPVYKPHIDISEELSLKQCFTILNKYDIIFIGPEDLKTEYYSDFCKENNKKFKFISFKKECFQDLHSYSNLLLQSSFYKTFSDYKYILLYQLDALVFSDQLEYWCEQDYDYIGAPWFDGMDRCCIYSKMQTYGGNGGLSLRKVESAIQILDDLQTKKVRLKRLSNKYTVWQRIKWFCFYHKSLKQMIDDSNLYEDIVWVKVIRRFFKNYRVALGKIAQKFSAECNARVIYHNNADKLPFGCHAYLKYEPDFWSEFLPEIKIIQKQLEEADKQKKAVKSDLPIITIITATYNLITDDREEHFRHMVESVQHQSYPNIEHLIIDGASKDGTLELIESLINSRDINNIRILSEPDTGIYNAFNKGIKVAKGEYILFMNSDDYFTTELAITSLYNKLIDTNSDFVFANHVNDYEKDKLNHCNSTIKMLPYRNTICQQTMLYKKSLFAEFGYFDEQYSVCADYDFTIKMVNSNCRHAKVPHTLVFFRYTGFSSYSINTAVNESLKILDSNFYAQYNFSNEKLYQIYLYNNINIKTGIKIISQLKKYRAKYLRPRIDLQIYQIFYDILRLHFIIKPLSKLFKH